MAWLGKIEAQTNPTHFRVRYYDSANENNYRVVEVVIPVNATQEERMKILKEKGQESLNDGAPFPVF